MSDGEAEVPRWESTGHYEFRPHPVAGLVEVVWIDPGRPTSIVVVIHRDRVAKLTEAGNAYLAEQYAAAHPKPTRTEGNDS